MDWNALLSNVLQAVLVILLPPLVVFVARWLQAKAQQALAAAKSYQPELTDLLLEAVQIAVKAAEQAGAAGFIADKKQYAISVAEKWLGTHGFTVDLDLLDAAIEAAVQENFGKSEIRAAVPGSGTVKARIIG